MSRTTFPENDGAHTPPDRSQDGTGDDPREGGATAGRPEENGTGGGGLRRAAAGAGLVLMAGAGALLSVGAFLGLYVRPVSDDWCALWKARDLGVLGISADFYRTQNGRVTNAFLTGVLYADDMTGPKLLPTLLVVTLGAGLFLLAREALRALRLPVPAVVLAAAVAVVEALLFFAGTRPYQALLWAPATLSHTVPSVLGVWAVIWAVRAARGGSRARAAAVAGALLVGVAAGMLSEPFVVTAGTAAAVVGVLCLPGLGRARDRYAATWCTAWCLGLGIGLVLLTTSPGARWRRAQQPEKPLTAAELGETVRDWLRIWETIGGQWAYAGALAAGVLLGLAVAFAAGDRGPHARPGGTARPPLWLLAVLPVPLIALASLVAAYGLRSGYGPTGWTYARTWTSFLVPFLLALGAYGAWLGHTLGRRFGSPDPKAPDLGRAPDADPERTPAPGAKAPGPDRRPPETPRIPVARRDRAVRLTVLVLAGSLTAASLAALVPTVRTTATQTVSRSVAWDRQNARIRAGIADGATEVTYRPLLIGGLAEPFFTEVYARDWAARCAATYYGVDRLRRG
ncbi:MULTISPECIES: hypothetical protein [unclassified Streptomyces]|uniref:hypothetical protein n=1 Tax=unclassified Streptomyces TaxID=2593676 RepID=UPI00369830AD